MVSMDAKTIHARSNKRRSGFGTVVSSLIMVVAVAILGSVVLIWANSSLNVERTKIANDFATNSNLLKESFIVEDVWLNIPPKLPNNYVNLTLKNLGDISIDIKEVKIDVLDGSGVPRTSCTPTCSITMTTFSNNIDIIASKQTSRIDAGTIDLQNTNSKSLDISITTERGTVEKILWSLRP